MPQTHGAHDLPYRHASSKYIAERIQRICVWDNQVGVVVSHAGNAGLEGSGNAHTYWVPKGDYSGALAGTHVTGEAGGAKNYTVDTIDGGPGNWRSHLFTVDTNGFDRMFVEWRGKVTSALTGGTLDGLTPGIALPRSYFFSVGYGWATGTFVEEDALPYMREPPVICYNDAQEGKLASPMWGASGTAGYEPQQIATHMPLWCAGMGPAGRQAPTSSDVRALKNYGSATPMWGAGQSVISSAGLLWGYQQASNGTPNVDQSRYPQVGDRLGRTMQIGYSKLGGHSEGGADTGPYFSDLRISGLSRVWFSMAELFPPTSNAGISNGNLWPAGPASRLNWTVGSATMTIIGKIHVILLRD